MRITMLGATSALVFIASTALVPAAEITSRPALVAQTSSSKSAETQENDARMTACSRYRAAYKRLGSVKLELSELQNNFGATDDIRPKLDALVTQTNDAMTTAEARIRSCPVKLR